MKFADIISSTNVSSRSIRNQITYLRYLDSHRDDPCEMCRLGGTHIDKKDPNQVVHRGKAFFITKNLFPYAVWDGSPVVDHLLIVPTRHTDAIGSFSPEELQEWAELIKKYEDMNYSVYARSANNSAKSVVHQHSHLIAVGPRPKHFRRPKHALKVFFREAISLHTRAYATISIENEQGESCLYIVIPKLRAR